MPILKNRPPKYRHHKGVNQAIVSFQGKVIYLGTYGSPASHAKYQEILAQWLQLHGPEAHQAAVEASEEKRTEAVIIAEEKAALAQLESITASTLRSKRLHGGTIYLAELILVFERHAQQYYRKNDKVTREAELIVEVCSFLEQHHGEVKADAFGPVDLDNLRDKMIDDLDWSRKYINKQVGRLIRMFKWAASKELVKPTIPAALEALTGLKKGRCKARETAGVRCVDDKLVDATLANVGEVVGDMIRFQRLTGARPGEVCSIRPCDIDRSRAVWVYVPSEHKTEHYKKNRFIAIGPKAQQVLLSYLLRDSESYCFSPAESEERRRRRNAENRKTPLSCGNKRHSNRVAAPKRTHSDHYKVSSYRMAIRRACKKNALEVWSPNQLRHTAATEIRRDFGLEAAQVVCGHQSADVTQIYAERDLELAMKVAQAVG